MSTVAERVKKIVVEHLGVDADKVVPEASFIDDLGADSLDTVELVMAFEEEFSIEIPDDAAETIQTVGDAIGFIEKNAAACPRPPSAVGVEFESAGGGIKRSCRPFCHVRGPGTAAAAGCRGLGTRGTIPCDA